MTKLTEAQITLLAFIVHITALIGMIGSITTLIFYARKVSEGRLSRHVIFVHMVCAEFLFELALFLGPWAQGNKIFCTVQASVFQLFLSSLLWCLTLALDMVLRVGFLWSDSKMWRLLPFCYFFCWGIPIVISITLAIRDFYTPLGAYCWVGPDYPEVRLAVFYLWLWVIYAGVTICSVYLAVRLIRVKLGVGHQITGSSMRAVAQVLSYSVVMFLVWLPTCVLYFHERLPQGHTSYTLILINIIVTPMWGFFNCAVYVFPTISQKRKGHPTSTQLSALSTARINAEFSTNLQTPPVVSGNQGTSVGGGGWRFFMPLDPVDETPEHALATSTTSIFKTKV